MGTNKSNSILMNFMVLSDRDRSFFMQGQIRYKHPYLYNKDEFGEKDAEEAYQEILGMDFESIKRAIARLRRMDSGKSVELVERLEETEKIRVRLLISDENEWNI